MANVAGKRLSDHIIKEIDLNIIKFSFGKTQNELYIGFLYQILKNCKNL